MALVDYSDSDSESDPTLPSAVAKVSPDGTEKEKSSKRKRDAQEEEARHHPSSLPPLPSSFHSLYASSVRTSTTDDPALHGGRKRQVPHSEGNWPTHVYLEWYPSKTELHILHDLIAQASSLSGSTAIDNSTQIHSLLHSDLGAQLPLHVSLSAPLVLQTHQKNEFEELLEEDVKEAAIKCFDISPTGVDCVPNYDRSRSFFVLRLGQPAQDELNRLLNASNGCAGSFGLPLLYADRPVERHSVKAEVPVDRFPARNDRSSAFHVSIAWQLGEATEQQRDRMAELDTATLSGLKIAIHTVKIKVGNVVKDISLRQTNF